MEYKVTRQYAQDLEIPIAEFTHEQDANFFIQRKILADIDNNVRLIYRLFDSRKLLKVFKEKITSPIREGDYAIGEKLFPKSFGSYKVCKMNAHQSPHAAFTELADAQLFVEENLLQEKDIISYYIFDANNKLIEESTQRVKKHSPADESQGKGQTSSSRPTPFATAPRPANSPPSWIKEDKEDKN